MSEAHIAVLLWIILFVALLMSTTLGTSMSYTKGVYVIKNFQGSKASYGHLVGALQSASKGQQLTIVLRNNYGGYNHIREYLDRAVQSSRAKVIIEIDGYVGSNAALFFRMGDLAIVPHSARIMFHQSYIETWFGYKYPKHLYLWSLRIHSKVGAFTYMTKAERRAWENRKNVYISGKRVCNSKFVIRQHSSYCIIRGQK